MTMYALPQVIREPEVSTAEVSARFKKVLKAGLKHSFLGFRDAGQYRAPAVETAESSLDSLMQALFEVRVVAPTIETACALSEGELVSREYCVRASAALDHYRTLVDGWDGEDALAPTDERLNAASAFLYMLCSIVESCPDVSPMLDEEGIPGLFWDTGRAYFSVSFYDDHELACVYRNRETGQKKLFEANLHQPADLEQAWAFIESL